MRANPSTPTSKPVVSCVIPCLNEAESLPTVIKEIFSSNLAKEWPCEIVVADNGSTDGSQELANTEYKDEK